MESAQRKFTEADAGVYSNNADGTRQGNWMQTFTGKQYYPLDPRADEISIIDIAHSLAYQCRYAGHCDRYYSVAEHSVYVSQLLQLLGEPVDVILWGLIHDAPEAYMTDLPRPIKGHMPEYNEIEDVNMAVIAARFGLDPVMPQIVKDFDNGILSAEKDQIMGEPPEDWNLPPVPKAVADACAELKIDGMPPDDAERFFMARFAEVMMMRHYGEDVCLV